MGSPVYNPPVPYTGHIPGGFLPGRMVRVQGRVLPTANYISINLQTGPNPYDDVALHVNPRLSENVIVRNAKSNANWGPEERHGPPMSIYRDQSFEILILSEPSVFKIAVNGQHFAEFNHRVPVDRVSYLRVEGDLSISLIQFDGTAQPSSAYGASAPPMGYAPVGGGGAPYPPASALPTPGFTMPMAAAGVGAAAAYPHVGGGGVPSYPPPQQPYGGYPPSSGPSTGGYYPQQPAGYPSPGQPQGYYQPGGAPHYNSGSSGGSGGGLLSDASKLLAGGLAGVGLAKVANKIPGMGGSHGHHGYHGGGNINPLGGGHGHGGGGGMLGKAAGLLGPAAALGVGGALAGKKAKKNKKLLKYGLPIGGAVVGGYALKKGMKGFHGHGSSSSSSSSSEEE